MSRRKSKWIENVRETKEKSRPIGMMFAGCSSNEFRFSWRFFSASKQVSRKIRRWCVEFDFFQPIKLSELSWTKFSLNCSIRISERGEIKTLDFVKFSSCAVGLSGASLKCRKILFLRPEKRKTFLYLTTVDFVSFVRFSLLFNK